MDEGVYREWAWGCMMSGRGGVWRGACRCMERGRGNIWRVGEGCMESG